MRKHEVPLKKKEKIIILNKKDEITIKDQILTFSNTLNKKALEELRTLLTNEKNNESSKFLIMTGHGQIFCNGIDLHYLVNGHRKKRAGSLALAIREFVNEMVTFPKPIIVAVNGRAHGLGMSIVLLGDIVYASSEASFSCSFIDNAQTTEGAISFTLPHLVGKAQASAILIGGETISANAAEKSGLVSQVFVNNEAMMYFIGRKSKDIMAKPLMMETPRKLGGDVDYIAALHRKSLMWFLVDFIVFIPWYSWTTICALNIYR